VDHIILCVEESDTRPPICSCESQQTNGKNQNQTCPGRKIMSNESIRVQQDFTMYSVERLLPFLPSFLHHCRYSLNLSTVRYAQTKCLSELKPVHIITKKRTIPMMLWEGMEKQVKPLSCIILDGTQGRRAVFKLGFAVQSFLIYRASQYNLSKLINGVHVYCLTNPVPILTIKPS